MVVCMIYLVCATKVAYDIHQCISPNYQEGIYCEDSLWSIARRGGGGGTLDFK